MNKLNFYRVLLILSIVIIIVLLFVKPDNNKMEQQIISENTVLSVIHSRKSVRNYEPDKTVSREDVEILIKAGMAAPSGKDNRPWEILIIDDRSLLDKLGEELPTAKMLKKAPMAIIVCGDTTRSFYWYIDCSAVTQNILLAAESMGLGAVWTAAYPYEDRMSIVIENAGLPENILPLAVIPVGYPNGNEKPKDKYDASKVHFNKGVGNRS